jgi:hypothetical protein
MKINQLASMKNLELAWRRITTGGNYQYKRLYRPVYYAYEVALKQNLKDLRQRLRGGSFEARHPERIYVPKASGLHRPLALLSIEDQIVLQAFGNLAAKRMQKRRAPLQFKVVFSNILERPDSIFFFRKWQDTYGAFQRRIKKHYAGGLRWVGDFDLAAFYDTISHELLLRTIYPRTTNADLGRSTPEPGLAVCPALHERGLKPYCRDSGIPVRRSSGQVSWHSLLAQSPGRRVRPCSQFRTELREKPLGIY